MIKYRTTTVRMHWVLGGTIQIILAERPKKNADLGGNLVLIPDIMPEQVTVSGRALWRDEGMTNSKCRSPSQWKREASNPMDVTTTLCSCKTLDRDSAAVAPRRFPEVKQSTGVSSPL